MSEATVSFEAEQEGLAEVRELAELIADLHQRAMGIVSTPRSALQRLNDRTTIAPFEQAVKFQLQAAASHLTMFIASADANDTIPYGGYSLLRGALESGATAQWLLNPGTDAKRVLRSLQLAWWDQESTADFAKSAGLDYSDDLLRIQEHLDKDRQRMKALQQRSLRSERVHRTAVLKEVDTKMKPKLVPSVETAWRLCSGLAHGNQPMTGTVMQRRYLEGAPENFYVVSSSWSLVAAITRTAFRVVDDSVKKLEALARG